MEKIFNGKLVSSLLVVLIIFVAFLAINELQQIVLIGADVEPQATINVAGEASVFAVSNLAVARITVQNEAPEAEAAQEENTNRSNRVIEFLKNKGIEDSDIKTVRYDISPRYEFIERERRLAGYQAVNTLEVKIRDLDVVGDIFDGAVNAGANRVDSLRFTIEDETALRREARQKAINDAKRKAEELAEDLGVRLIRIVSFNEDSRLPIIWREAGLDMPMAEPAPEVPRIEPGEEEIKIYVNITYEIR